MSRLKKLVASKKETRTYKITSDKDFLDKLEMLFSDVKSLGILGASRTIELFIDGDGTFYIGIEKEDGELVKFDRDGDIDEIKYDFG